MCRKENKKSDICFVNWFTNKWEPTQHPSSNERSKGQRRKNEQLFFARLAFSVIRRGIRDPMPSLKIQIIPYFIFISDLYTSLVRRNLMIANKSKQFRLIVLRLRKTCTLSAWLVSATWHARMHINAKQPLFSPRKEVANQFKVTRASHSEY